MRQANQRWGGFAQPPNSSGAPDWRSSQEAQRQQEYYGDDGEPQMGRRRDSWDTGYNRASRYREDSAGAGDAPGEAFGARVSGGRGERAAAEFEMAQLAVTGSRESRQGGVGIGGERAPVHQSGEQSRGPVVGELVDTSSLDDGPASFERPPAAHSPTTNEQQLIDLSDWGHSNFESEPAPISTAGATDWGHSNLGFSQDTTGGNRSQRLQLPTIPPPPPSRPRGTNNTNPFK